MDRRTARLGVASRSRSGRAQMRQLPGRVLAVSATRHLLGALSSKCAGTLRTAQNFDLSRFIRFASLRLQAIASDIGSGQSYPRSIPCLPSPCSAARALFCQRLAFVGKVCLEVGESLAGRRSWQCCRFSHDAASSALAYEAGCGLPVNGEKKELFCSFYIEN
jgi:hypothetical protein